MQSVRGTASACRKTVGDAVKSRGGGLRRPKTNACSLPQPLPPRQTQRRGKGVWTGRTRRRRTPSSDGAGRPGFGPCACLPLHRRTDGPSGCRRLSVIRGRPAASLLHPAGPPTPRSPVHAGRLGCRRGIELHPEERASPLAFGHVDDGCPRGLLRPSGEATRLGPAASRTRGEGPTSDSARRGRRTPAPRTRAARLQGSRPAGRARGLRARTGVLPVRCRRRSSLHSTRRRPGSSPARPLVTKPPRPHEHRRQGVVARRVRAVAAPRVAVGVPRRGIEDLEDAEVPVFAGRRHLPVGAVVVRQRVERALAFCRLDGFSVVLAVSGCRLGYARPWVCVGAWVRRRVRLPPMVVVRG